LDKIYIYHHPRCGKSRQTLELIKNRNIEPVVIEYVKTPPTTEELTEIIRKLNIDAKSLIRKNERVFLDNFDGKDLSSEEWIQVMIEHPILIERPIVIKGDKAAIGRPPETILSIL
jgi:arsenate reductase (glutaredoxin)